MQFGHFYSKVYDSSVLEFGLILLEEDTGLAGPLMVINTSCSLWMYHCVPVYDFYIIC